MFRCDQCRKPQGSRVQPIKTIVERRNVSYPAIKGRDGRERTPQGWEIVKELDLCATCAKEHRASLV